MKLPRRKFLRLAASAAAVPALPRVARAQVYPTRPITIVVPFAPGGSTDVIGRLLAERIRSSLQQTIIVENVAGANGSVGVGRVARATPDGYTVVLGLVSTHVFNGALYTLPYDVLNDFEPILLISTTPYVIVAKNSIPAVDLKGLIAWFKVNPDKASVGTADAGSAHHISGALFQRLTDTRFQFVPYRGGAPAMQDLVAGQIDVMFDSATTALPPVIAGSIKAFAVMDKTRLLAAPNMPTVDEAGLPNFYLSAWYALWAPKGTPQSVVARLNSAARDALVDTNVRARLADIGQDIFPADRQTPEALGTFQKAEIERWWPIIKTANIKGE